MFTTRKLSMTIIACLVFVPTGFADTLHKFGKRDGYWHHDSGWVFPGRIGPFELAGSPTEMDGSGDVTATYTTVGSNGSSRTANVDVFHPSSASRGAKLFSAKADMEAKLDSAKCSTSRSEKAFVLKDRPAIVGTRVTFAGDCSKASLYFFQAAHWVIAVRTTAAAEDSDAAAALDEFMRALPWDTLDTDPTASDLSP